MYTNAEPFRVLALDIRVLQSINLILDQIIVKKMLLTNVKTIAFIDHSVYKKSTFGLHFVAHSLCEKVYPLQNTNFVTKLSAV